MIYLHLDGLPPSTNHAYINLRGGGRTLSTEGRKYRNETKAHLAQAFGPALRYLKPDQPYLLCVRFFFEDVQNTGWGKGKAKARYKALDVSNRLKLLEDCLKDAGGIDDSQNMRIVLDKQQGKEKTEIWIWNMEEEETPFDPGFLQLRRV